MSIPKFSPPGAMPASSQEFMVAHRAFDEAVMAAVTAFEATTSRIVRDVSLKWEDVTMIIDTKPQHVRLALPCWLPTRAEDEADEICARRMP